MIVRPTLPGSTIGILGSGQLGRMFALAARRMGYRVHVYSPESGTPAGQVADRETAAPYDDRDQLRQFAAEVDVITLEFENVPVESVRYLEGLRPVRPGAHVLAATQNRLREKRFLQQAGFPVAPFVEVRSESDLRAALPRFGGRAILKAAAWGYDGKGQFALTSPDHVDAAWRQLAGQEAVLEKQIDFQKEVSVIVARQGGSTVATYSPFQNEHHRHILDVARAPAELSSTCQGQAMECGRAVVEALQLEGLVCVEMFVDSDGSTLFINEIAPRPHNSGHLTMEAHVTSQFEQQVRAVCGLPLGSTEQLCPAAMANLLGDLWSAGEPAWVEGLRDSAVKLHLYGKTDPRPGRKMGHVTALAESASAAATLVRDARRRLHPT